MYKFLAFLLVIFSYSISAKELQKLNFGVFPHLPTHKLHQLYTPVANDFKKVTGLPVIVKTQPNFIQYEATLRSEIYDIAVIQPFDYPEAHDKHNYHPLATRSNELAAIVIVRKESEIQNISDLNGKTIAHPAKSAAVTRLAERMFKKEGFNLNKDLTLTYKNNHFSCLQNVLIKKADACVTTLIVLKHYEDEKVMNRFRIVAESETIPHVLYVIHDRVPESIRKKIKQAILTWHKTPEGRKILSISRTPKFKEALDHHYDVLREKIK